MGTNSIQFRDICKSDNEFSFLSTIVDLVGNRRFKAGSADALCSDTDCILNESSNIWLSLSAVGQEIGGIFQSNINNFIDNLVNIDTCTVKGLQSLADILGTDYVIFNNIDDFPIDIIKMLDVLSIKKEYLASSKHVKKALADSFIANAKQPYNENTAKAVLSVNIARSELCSSASNIRDFYLSAEDWHSLNAISSDSIQLSAIDSIVSATFYDFLLSKLCATYNDNLNTNNSTVIYKDLSSAIIDNDFKLPNQYEDDIEKIRLQYNISYKFDVSEEADNIDNGLSTEDDYSEYQWKMLELEFQRRKDPFDPLQLQTRNAYYKQAEVKQYFEFIKNYYTDLISAYLSADTYSIDNEYLVLSAQFEGKEGKTNKSLLSVDEDGNPVLKYSWISFVAYDLHKLASSIRDIREQLKHFCQKNFMKGTFLLISYVINEYLKFNTIAALDKLSAVNASTIQSKPTYSKNNTTVDLIEYIDPVNYFNIQTEDDKKKEDFQKDKTLNPRFWEVNSTVDAIGAIDTTNIFSVPPTVNSNAFAFDLQQISAFYHDIMKVEFSKYKLKSLSGMSYDQHLVKFLATVFDFGADKIYKDEAGNVIYEIEDNALSTYKKDLHFRYSADSDSELPFYYYSNMAHPSYQIHPYLSTFMEKADYDYPIQNIASIVQEDVISLVKDNINKYIDSDGYLINLWNNPLGANQDYQSHYETADHIDNNGNTNPVFGYDGLFYPPAIEQLRDNSSILIDMLSSGVPHKTVSDTVYVNYYYGISLSDGDKNKLHKQLTELKSYLIDIAFSRSTKISKYGLDIYGNAYILVKDMAAGKDQPGVLFVRKYGHPIAFPAYVFRHEEADDDLSFVHIDNGLKSLANRSLYENAADKIEISTPALTTPGIVDFIISIDRQDIAIAIRRKHDGHEVLQIPIANIVKDYNVAADQNTIALNKIQTAESSVEFLYSNNTYDQQLKLGCFSSNNNKLTTVLYKLVGKKLTLAGATYDYDDIKSPMKQFIEREIPLDIKTGSNVVFAMNNSGMLAVAYVADSGLANVENYLHNQIVYNTTNSNDPAAFLAHRFKNNIALKVFKVLWSFESAAIEEDSNIKDTSYFNCYTYNGFFGLLPDTDNDISQTALKDEFEKRGILKFQLVGRQKTKAIDFKLCLPVRVREKYGKDVEYSSDGKYAYVKYDHAHFMEDILSASSQSAASDTDSHIDPVTVNKVLNGNNAGIMLDEQYFNVMKGNIEYKDINRLFDQVQTGPYLIAGDLPMNYYNPGHNVSAASPDNFKFNLLGTSYPEISCSWKEESGKIAIDFNTALFNDIGSDENNYFNEKRCFLHLAGAGDAGYLNLYNARSFDNIAATLYIKNVSTDKPLFIVAVEKKTTVQKHYLKLEDNTQFLTLEDGDLIY